MHWKWENKNQINQTGPCHPKRKTGQLWLRNQNWTDQPNKLLGLVVSVYGHQLIFNGLIWEWLKLIQSYTHIYVWIYEFQSFKLKDFKYARSLLDAKVKHELYLSKWWRNMSYKPLQEWMKSSQPRASAVLACKTRSQN